MDNNLYTSVEQFIADFLGINRRSDSETNLNYVDFFKNKFGIEITDDDVWDFVMNDEE